MKNSDVLKTDAGREIYIVLQSLRVLKTKVNDSSLVIPEYNFLWQKVRDNLENIEEKLLVEVNAIKS